MESEFIKSFFDYKGLLSKTRENVLTNFKTFEDYSEYLKGMCIDSDKQQEAAKELYVFINDSHYDELFLELEVCEDNQISCDINDYFVFSLYEDTSEYNEGGSHLGGYEYEFTVEVNTELLVGLEVVNHN